MKKPGTDTGYPKSGTRLVARQKKAKAVEASLQARTTKAVKAIALGSAALGIITLGLFATKKWKKRKSFFS